MGCESCIGKCCEKFALPYDPAGIEQCYKDWVFRITTIGEANSTVNLDNFPKVVLDIDIIYNMLIYLGQETIDPNNNPIKNEENPQHYYTCKNWNKETKKCNIYEMRPYMCREYPSKACEYDGCSYKQDKTKIKKTFMGYGFSKYHCLGKDVKGTLRNMLIASMTKICARYYGANAGKAFSVKLEKVKEKEGYYEVIPMNLISWLFMNDVKLDIRGADRCLRENVYFDEKENKRYEWYSKDNYFVVDLEEPENLIESEVGVDINTDEGIK